MQETNSRRQEETVLEETLRVARPWGFDLRSIGVPVAVWQGEEDIGCTPVSRFGMDAEPPFQSLVHRVSCHGVNTTRRTLDHEP